MDIDLLRDRSWILLPGTLCTAEVFKEFLDHVGVEVERRFPIALKHPRINDYIPEFEHVMRPGAVICGFSLGAIVAAHLANRFDAAALLLFGLNPFADDLKKAPGRRSFEKDVNMLGGRAALQLHLPAIHGQSAARTKEVLLSMADENAGFIKEQTALALNRPGAMTALASARYPVRLLTGTNDTSAPFAFAQAAAKTAIDGRALELGGLGHYALVEDAKLCHATLIEGISQ